MRKIILTQASQAILTGIVTFINNAVNSFKPFSVNLTDKEKEGGRSMAEGREGYVRLVSAIANQHPNSLSRADNPADLVSLLNYYSSLAADIQAAYALLEMVEETQLGAACDIMELVDRYVENLQIDRNNNAALDLAMREVDEWNKRFGQRNTVVPSTLRKPVNGKTEDTETTENPEIQ